MLERSHIVDLNVGVLLPRKSVRKRSESWKPGSLQPPSRSEFGEELGDGSASSTDGGTFFTNLHTVDGRADDGSPDAVRASSGPEG